MACCSMVNFHSRLSNRDKNFSLTDTSRYPELITHVFSICTPYTAPSEKYFPIEDIVKGPVPQFAYQMHLASGEVEKVIKDEETIRQFLKGMYGAKGPNGEVVFNPTKGVLSENLAKVGEGVLLKGKVRC